MWGYKIDMYIKLSLPGILIRKYRSGNTGRDSFMCTCITFKNGDFYFGRNMDLEYSFGERVVITPRNFPFHFKYVDDQPAHYAMVGMATGGAAKEGISSADFPLYAEAVNEKGLCMAGLNFPGNAYYRKAELGKANIATFELIPWLLGMCASAVEAKEKLRDINITGDAFSESMPPAQLHWMLADRAGCFVIEAVREGIHIYENRIGVLTNNPPFEYHRMNLRNYLNVTAGYPEPRFRCAGDAGNGATETVDPEFAPYSQGMGAVGLPGDFSSASRFVKAAFLKWNSVCGQDEAENVSQFFHILDSVAMTRGAVLTRDAKYDITTYSSCVNADSGVYYYKTYGNSQINAVDIRRADVDGNVPGIYALESSQNIQKLN